MKKTLALVLALVLVLAMFPLTASAALPDNAVAILFEKDGDSSYYMVTSTDGTGITEKFVSIFDPANGEGDKSPYDIALEKGKKDDCEPVALVLLHNMNLDNYNNANDAHWDASIPVVIGGALYVDPSFDRTIDFDYYAFGFGSIAVQVNEGNNGTLTIGKEAIVGPDGVIAYDSTGITINYTIDLKQTYSGVGEVTFTNSDSVYKAIKGAKPTGMGVAAKGLLTVKKPYSFDFFNVNGGEVVVDTEGFQVRELGVFKSGTKGVLTLREDTVVQDLRIENGCNVYLDEGVTLTVAKDGTLWNCGYIGEIDVFCGDILISEGATLLQGSEHDGNAYGYVSLNRLTVNGEYIAKGGSDVYANYTTVGPNGVATLNNFCCFDGYERFENYGTIDAIDSDEYGSIYADVFYNNGTLNIGTEVEIEGETEFLNDKKGVINIADDTRLDFILYATATNAGSILGPKGELYLYLNDNSEVPMNFYDYGKNTVGYVYVGDNVTYTICDGSGLPSVGELTSSDRFEVSELGELVDIRTPAKKDDGYTYGGFDAVSGGGTVVDGDTGAGTLPMTGTGTGTTGGTTGTTGATTAYRSLASRLNYRTGPGAGYPVAGQIPMNTLIDVIKVEDGWACWVTSDGQTVWSSTAYLVSVAAVEAGQTVTTTANLNMRTGPGTTFGIAGVLPRGTQVTITGVEGEWATAVVNGQTIYLHTGYLR